MLGLTTSLPEAAGLDDRVALVMPALILDPRLLYAVDLGDDESSSAAVWLSQEEILARMGLLLWGGAPAGGDPSPGTNLQNSGERAAHARTMLLNYRARRAVHHFHAQWLGYAGPLPAGARGPIRGQAEHMLDHVVFDDPTSWTELFLTTEAYLDEGLHELYELGLRHRSCGTPGL